MEFLCVANRFYRPGPPRQRRKWPQGFPKMTRAGSSANIPPMLKALRRLFTGPTNAAILARPALAEPLERRTHLDTTAPTLVHEQLIGNDPRRVEGVVLTFSEPLDEVSAESLEHYRVGK